MTIPPLRRVRHPPGEARHAVNVNGGERLVEQPTARRGSAIARRASHLAPLPGREPGDRHVPQPRQPGLRQRLRYAAVAGVEEVQVPAPSGGDLRTSPAGAPSTAGRNGSCRARGAGLAPPVHLAAVRARQPGQQAQQGGFSRAVANAGDPRRHPPRPSTATTARETARPLVPLSRTDPASSILLINVLS